MHTSGADAAFLDSVETILLSSAYLPPVSYIQSCIRAEKIIFEKHEHFVKQTYRNRCSVYGANGKLNLVIPVQHQIVYRLPMCNVRISYNSSWNKIHWRSLESAYRKSAFFEYYEDQFKKHFEEPEEFLFDFNQKLLEKIFSILEVKAGIFFTESWTEMPEQPIADLRFKAHQKESGIQIQNYYQVFNDKFGFLPDLSILDLLFNEGPAARSYLF